MKLVVATRNPGKIIEMRSLLSKLPVAILSPEEAGVIGEAIEDGKTFESNAKKKAEYVRLQTNSWCVADDSGLSIDILNGEPGVLSARWAGEGATDEQILRYTLGKLEGSAHRSARFETAAVLISPEGKSWTFMGSVEGVIAESPRGIPRPKLPYDQIFIPRASGGKTFAELSDQKKNAISHRGIAFRKLRDFLASLDNNFHSVR